ncbi:hypothetical protein [Flavisolibacter tropicus]|uniref:hypothetical protein n=1 Tax=Flavisolibacter tropicus TaxID=1492898 RepID=UPI0011E033D2|nr:hypothetical protein [Flavisolibacter tropicus]
MSRDKKPTAREEKAPHPPSNNKPVANTRRPEFREHIELFRNNGNTSHRIRSERQILWENDLYERQSI